MAMPIKGIRFVEPLPFKADPDETLFTFVEKDTLVVIPPGGASAFWFNTNSMKWEELEGEDV